MKKNKSRDGLKLAITVFLFGLSGGALFSKILPDSAAASKAYIGFVIVWAIASIIIGARHENS